MKELKNNLKKCYKIILKNNKSVNKKYLKRYIKFLYFFNKENINYDSSIMHKHHILPVSLFNEFKNEKWNIIKLSFREHYIAHYLLAKIFGGKMWYAFNNMNSHYKKINSKLYEKGIKELSIISSETMKKWYSKNPHPKGMKGKKHTEETKIKIGEKSNKTLEEKVGVKRRKK